MSTHVPWMVLDGFVDGAMPSSGMGPGVFTPFVFLPEAFVLLVFVRGYTSYNSYCGHAQSVNLICCWAEHWVFHLKTPQLFF